MFRFYGGLLVLLLGSVALTLASITQGPDRDLHFLRKLPSSHSPAELGMQLTDVGRWPDWFHSLEKVRFTDGAPGASLAKGRRIELLFNEHRNPWSRFTVGAEVLEASPSHLRLAVVSDSKKKLDAIFSRLEWEVSIQPSARGANVVGEAYARTCNWRSRLFGAVMEKVLMNQVYYPNVIDLAELKRSSATPGSSPAPMKLEILPPSSR